MTFIRFSACGAVMAALLACGGSVVGVDGGDDGGADGSSLDGGPDGSPSGCPASPPTASAACAQNNLKCEYGTNPNADCNQIFQCMSGAWVNETTGTFCPPQTDCPTTYAQVPVNQDCTPQSLTCAYPEGECICTTSFGGVQKQTPAWNCIPKTDGCPSPRPDIGTPCSTTAHCDYGACSGGVALDCVNGVWQETAVLCPN